ncbi:MAG: VRR-NUC domain-containing protein [Firmicutes bacterium]|nr:VRR-NUC domain-containing protein [[Eubacterium] siraeum]MCM1486799.1 VRR-NUC domain-containing protein [Bacillota bacterium]
MQHIEDAEQINLIKWAEFQSCKYPELELLFHIPNGGKRNVREAARFKMLGVKAGVPDLCLPVPRGGYHGLYIEMKSPEGRTTAYQKKWLERLAQQGYDTAVCHSFEEAQEKIIKYMLLDK